MRYMGWLVGWLVVGLSPIVTRGTWYHRQNALYGGLSEKTTENSYLLGRQPRLRIEPSSSLTQNSSATRGANKTRKNSKEKEVLENGKEEASKMLCETFC